jgi:D-alanyl-D-alanine carboxypeptidase
MLMLQPLSQGIYSNLASVDCKALVFSIIVNKSDQSAATLRQAINDIVLLLTRLHPC